MIREILADYTIPCAVLFAVVGVTIGCHDENDKDGNREVAMPIAIEEAIKDAQAGYRFSGSALHQRPLSNEEVEAAEAYIRQHPDVSSYILLMALRKHAPEAYSALPNPR